MPSATKFIKWGMRAFENLRVVPPGSASCTRSTWNISPRGGAGQRRSPIPDTLVGTDSPHDHDQRRSASSAGAWRHRGRSRHARTAVVLPDAGRGRRASDRQPARGGDRDRSRADGDRDACAKKVVGKFVEFFGPALRPERPDRATIANMAPEYGATMGFFPVDDATVAYLMYRHRRSDAEYDTFRAYFTAQGLLACRREIDYSDTLEIRLEEIDLGVAGPEARRTASPVGDEVAPPNCFPAPSPMVASPGSPANRPAAWLPHGHLAATKSESAWRVGHGGNGRQPSTTITGQRIRWPRRRAIAAITSAPTPPTGRHARRRPAGEEGGRAGLRATRGKTSLAPGSRVVTDYLTRPACPFLEQLGFNVVAYGCTTCIGNAGPARCPRSKPPSRAGIWSAPRCFPATAISRRASTPSRPATRLRRWSSPSPSPPVNIDLMTGAAGRGGRWPAGS